MSIVIDYSEVGKRIRSARKECNMTQEELAVACGCSSNHLSAIETGDNRPSLELIVTISTVLKCSLDFLFMDHSKKCSIYMIETQIVPKLEKCTYYDLKHVDRFIDEMMEYRDGLLAPAKV